MFWWENCTRERKHLDLREEAMVAARFEKPVDGVVRTTSIVSRRSASNGKLTMATAGKAIAHGTPAGWKDSGSRRSKKLNWNCEELTLDRERDERKGGILQLSKWADPLVNISLPSMNFLTLLVTWSAVQ